MPRVRRNFDRISGLRNPDLIVIACEGENTEVRYFEGVRAQSKTMGSQLKILPLPKRAGHLSAPSDVLAQLDDYKREFGLKRLDELCLVIDRDLQSWTESEIASVAKSCSSKGYLLALSNPCFELWLILHFEDASLLTDETKAIWLENKNRFLKQKLDSLSNGRLPSRLDNQIFLALTRIAVANAKKLDVNSDARWPNELGTRVYKVLEKVLAEIDGV